MVNIRDWKRFGYYVLIMSCERSLVQFTVLLLHTIYDILIVLDIEET